MVMEKIDIRNNPDYSSGIVVHKDFLYINGLQRCGTTSTREYLLDIYSKNLLEGELLQYVARYHMPIRFCTETELKTKKILANIRNPFSFYISYVNYHISQKSGFINEEYGGFKDFKSILYDLLFKTNWSGFMSEFDGARYPKKDWKNNNKLNVGFYTKRYINMFFKDGINILNNWNTEEFFKYHDKKLTVTNIICMENLKSGIDTALKINDNIKIHQLNQSPFNGASKSLKYIIHEKYDKEMIDWVYEKDKIFFEKYYRS